MRKLWYVAVVAALGVAYCAHAAEPSDVVRVENQSGYELTIEQKVSIEGELVDGGWNMQPNEIYDEQYMADDTRLVFIAVEIGSGGMNQERIFSKNVSAHTKQMRFELVVKQDKTVTYSER